MDESLLLGLYTADVMRQIDVTAIQGVGIPGGHLMERAGLAVADEILERYEPEEAVVFAGKGNNGGDGFVVARELFNAGVEVTVFTLAPAGEYAGDAKLNLDILDKLGVDVREAFDAEGAPAEDAIMIVEMADVVVDAIFGTGFTGAAKGPAAAAIELINDAPGAVVSIDIASGVGATQDYVQAADWYRKAAEQNHSLAQFNLGTMYANGQGVAKDDAQSMIWFGRAANLGDAGGQYKMGRSCQRASMDGLPADAPEARIEAYKWYQLSAAQGYKNSEGAYVTLTFKMTRADVAEANARVAKFSVVKKLKPPQG